jgi:AcrR family transcriptional regulator
MTKKQEAILASSLELFATVGYDACATKTIAQHAKVSEGLIFKHFKNKQGLLAAILNQINTVLTGYLEPLSKIQHPKERLHAIIDIPFNVGQQDKKYWTLLYTLKWQQKLYNEATTDDLYDLIKKTFEALNAKHPEEETEVLLMFLDGAATRILLKNELKNIKEIQNQIKLKYDYNR